jgi:hypothetical protein
MEQLGVVSGAIGVQRLVPIRLRGLRLEFPKLFASFQIQRLQPAIHLSDVDDIARHGR